MKFFCPRGSAPTRRARSVPKRGRDWWPRLPAAVVGLMNSSLIQQQVRRPSPQRENCSVRKINMTISLAFLAPDLVKAAIDGRLPHGMGVARLTDSAG